VTLLNVLFGASSTNSMHRKELFQQLLNYLKNSKRTLILKEAVQVAEELLGTSIADERKPGQRGF
jgi:hypothetical protein